MDDPVPTPTGQEIRRAREAQRLTQAELADILNVGTRSIGRWERGETVPRSAIGALVDVLGLAGTSTDAGPPLQTATAQEILTELARRLGVTSIDTTQPIPSGATGRYRFAKSDAPSRQRRSLPEQQKASDREANG